MCCITPKIETVNCLLDLINHNVLNGWVVLQSTLLPWARNLAITQTYSHNPEFTHILFIDDDMAGFNREHVYKLLMADKPIISAIMTQRASPYRVVSSFKQIGGLDDSIMKGDILECNHTGMAFTLIKKEVLDATVEETTAGQVWFNTDRFPRQGFESEKESFINEALKELRETHNAKKPEEILEEAILLGQTAHFGATLCGEDVGFCKKAEKFGFNTYVHCGVQIHHIGEQMCNVQKTLSLGSLDSNVDELRKIKA